MPGITNEGFETKTFNQLKTEIETDFREVFGDNINLESTSLLGGLVGIITNNYSQLWELGSSVYLSRFADTATGSSLDRIVNLLNIERKQDFRTSGEVYLYGAVGTIVPRGTIVANRNDVSFQTIQDITLGEGVTPIMRLRKTVPTAIDSFVLNPLSNLYGLFTITGNFNVGSFGGTTDSIKTAFESYFGVGSITSVERDTEGFDAIGLLQDQDLVITFANNIFLPAFSAGSGIEVIYDRGGLANGAAVSVAAQNEGVFNISPGDINQIQTPIDNLDGVINFDPFIPGRLAETDAQLRERWYKRVSTPITSSKEAIENKIEELDGVIQAIVFETPGNIRCVVNGGENDEIAQAIYDNKPPGIDVLGQITGNAVDGRGNQQVLPFDRPSIIPVKVKVTITKTNTYPDNGDDIIRQSLIDYANNLAIGGKVIVSPDMVWALDGVSGIDNLKIEISVGDVGGMNFLPFTTNNYQLQNQQIINFSTINIVDNTP